VPCSPGFNPPAQDERRRVAPVKRTGGPLTSKTFSVRVNLATKRLSGRWKSSATVPCCTICPACKIATRSATASVSSKLWETFG
jgi:hypothetical protein